jgi:hypothetical protein
MDEKWVAKRDSVYLRAMAYTQTTKIVALSVTDESVDDVAEFRSRPGQGMDVAVAKVGAGDAPRHYKDPGRATRPGELAW